jgi:NAD(P)-dependent dehydrogenase (short-subunit alcohol dehydrogenase family)
VSSSSEGQGRSAGASSLSCERAAMKWPSGHARAETSRSTSRRLRRSGRCTSARANSTRWSASRLPVTWTTSRPLPRTNCSPTCERGSFTLTSGIFADRPARGVTGGGLISGALHSFVLSAAIELPRGLRVNVVSPAMAEDSADAYGDSFPDLKPVSMQSLVADYVRCVEGPGTGEIVRAYGDT